MIKILTRNKKSIFKKLFLGPLKAICQPLPQVLRQSMACYWPQTSAQPTLSLISTQEVYYYRVETKSEMHTSTGPLQEEVQLKAAVPDAGEQKQRPF